MDSCGTIVLMKKTPRKNKQWANEASQALFNAIELFREEHSQPTEEQKLELLAYAPLFAAMNRGIKDKVKLEKSQQNLIENMREELSAIERHGEVIDHSFLFLMSYIDCHVFHGYIQELKAENILDFISKNYDESLSI